MTRKKLKLSEELMTLSPSPCLAAMKWVREVERMGFNDNAIWKACTRGDWMVWFLYDAFTLANRTYYSARTVALTDSLFETLGRANNYDRGASELASAADLIREYFPEWPL